MVNLFDELKELSGRSLILGNEELIATFDSKRG
jgi:hypothetical protein